MSEEKILVVDVHKTMTEEGRSAKQAVEDAFRVNLDRHPDVSKVVAVDKGEIVDCFRITGSVRDEKSGRTHMDTKPLSEPEKRQIKDNLDVERKPGDRSAVRYKTMKSN